MQDHLYVVVVLVFGRYLSGPTGFENMISVDIFGILECNKVYLIPSAVSPSVNPSGWVSLISAIRSPTVVSHDSK